MNTAALALAAALLVGPAVANAQTPAFDPRAYQAQLHGEKTQILVLATTHLSGVGQGFDPAVLEPLLERLAAFAPTVIAIENLSGESLSGLRTYRAIYPRTADIFGRQLLVAAALGQAGTGLDMVEAEVEVRRLMAEWPEAPTPAQRRNLAAHLAASGDLNSTLVQWWRLEGADRRAGDGISRTLADYLERIAAQNNESHLIGARLAARLGLERVYPIDDQTNADIVQPKIEALMSFIEQPQQQAVFANAAFQHANASATRLTTGEQTLETYREINSPEVGQMDADTQWLTMIDRASPGGVGRTQVAGWEARNLRQVANIREVTANTPGARVLVLVGYSHKPWFDAYLSMMSDIEVVDAETILK